MVNEVQQTLVNAKEMSSTLAFCEYQNDLVVDLFPPGRPASWSRQALWFARTPRHGDLRRVVWCRRPGRSRRVVRRRSGLAQGVSRPSPRHARTRHLWRRLPRTGSGRLRIMLPRMDRRPLKSNSVLSCRQSTTGCCRILASVWAMCGSRMDCQPSERLPALA